MASEGRDGWLALGGTEVAPSEPNELNSTSRSFAALVAGELSFDPAPDELLAALIGRRGGAFGGGASGGGKIGTTVSLTNFSNASVGSSSPSSFALGTSERKSKSSDDNARELRGLAPPPRRENLLRNRDTAEGGGVDERGTTGSGAEL